MKIGLPTSPLPTVRPAMSSIRSSDFFEVEKFPTMTFVSKKVAAKDAEAQGGPPPEDIAKVVEKLVLRAMRRD